MVLVRGNKKSEIGNEEMEMEMEMVIDNKSAWCAHAQMLNYMYM